MKERALLLALRIAALCEEFSEREIQAAKRILEEQGVNSSLLACVAENTKPTPRKRRKAVKHRPIEEQRSKAVIELEQKDPEKYRVLSEFDLLLRKGSLLSTQDEIRKLGEKLSKSYSAGGSRRESISRLMVLMADLPLNEIRDLLNNSLAESKVDRRDSDYQRLAQFLITGKVSDPRDQNHTATTP
jgi:hypothetical protein